MPFLKIVVFGLNIQKEEITKKKRDAPKKVFSQYNGFLVEALCN
jgi:hypothetical protein